MTMSFSTMVLTGKNAASPHGTPGMTKVQRGDFVLFDLGVIYEGYCSDITRTVAYGDVSDEQVKSMKRYGKLKRLPLLRVSLVFPVLY